MRIWEAFWTVEDVLSKNKWSMLRIWSTRNARTKQKSYDFHEAKRIEPLRVPKGRFIAKGCFIFHAPQMRFIEKRKRPQNRGLFFFLAPRTGLEPVTSWLTVMRSTDWATEEYDVGLALSSRTASSRVFSAPHSLTSVFGMGTGGPCALWRPTLC